MQTLRNVTIHYSSSDLVEISKGDKYYAIAILGEGAYTLTTYDYTVPSEVLPELDCREYERITDLMTDLIAEVA